MESRTFQVCAVPVAAISLVDAERQWFKVKCRLAATQTSRDVAFGAQAILGVPIFAVAQEICERALAKFQP